MLHTYTGGAEHGAIEPWTISQGQGPRYRILGRAVSFWNIVLEAPQFSHVYFACLNENAILQFSPLLTASSRFGRVTNLNGFAAHGKAGLQGIARRFIDSRKLFKKTRGLPLC